MTLSTGASCTATTWCCRSSDPSAGRCDPARGRTAAHGPGRTRSASRGQLLRYLDDGRARLEPTQRVEEAGAASSRGRPRAGLQRRRCSSVRRLAPERRARATTDAASLGSRATRSAHRRARGSRGPGRSSGTSSATLSGSKITPARRALGTHLVEADARGVEDRRAEGGATAMVPRRSGPACSAWDGARAVAALKRERIETGARITIVWATPARTQTARSAATRRRASGVTTSRWPRLANVTRCRWPPQRSRVTSCRKSRGTRGR